MSTTLSFDKVLGSGHIQSSCVGGSNVAAFDTAAETNAGDGPEIEVDAACEAEVDAAGEADVDAVDEIAADMDSEPVAAGASKVDPSRGFDDEIEVKIDVEDEVTSRWFCSDLDAST